MKIFTTIIINFFLLGAYSNNILVNKDSSNTTVIVFEDSKGTQLVKNKKGKIIRNFAKNSVNVGLFGPIFGEVPIYYERYITDWFTIQAGVGITTRDFLGDFYNALSFGSNSKFKKQNNWNGINEYDVPDNRQGGAPSYQYRKAGVGFCVSLAPRFFPGISSTYQLYSGNAFDEGFYISPVIQYSIRNYKAQKVDVDGNYLKDDKIKEKTSSILFLLTAGWEKNFEPIMLNWNFGIGISSNNNTRLDVGYTYNQIDGTETYGNKINNYKSLTPYFKVGLDLGFTFGGKKKKKQE